MKIIVTDKNGVEYTYKGDKLRQGIAPEDPKIVIISDEDKGILGMHYEWFSVEVKY